MSRSRSAVASAVTAGLFVLAVLVGCGNAGGNGAPPDGARAAGSAEGQEAGGGAAPRRSPAGLPETTVRVAGIPVTVEVAETQEARQRGLMNRDSLPEDRGMLFVYPEERELSFWMRNTAIPLDIAFIDRTGRIVDIRQLEPFDEETVVSSAPAMYALEMNQGWFESHDVAPGDAVEF